MRADLIVLGAGPAGAAAAMEAAQHGLDVVVVDEAGSAGGQVFRADRTGAAGGDRDWRAGAALRAALAESGVRTLFGRLVWSVSRAFRVDAIGPAGAEVIEAPRIVAATGAVEFVAPFPGWTTPGVIGLAAATVLLKAHRMAPGRRVVVAGCGPLLAGVAAKLVGAGVDVAAVVDLSSARDWVGTLPRLLSRPALLAQGAGWALQLVRAGVPVLFRHGVRQAVGSGAVERVEVGPVDAEGSPLPGSSWFEADALCVGHGLLAASVVPSLLQAEHRFDAARGGWMPVLDALGRTSLAGLYAAGDSAGVAGAGPAAIGGRLAGLAAAADAGRVVADPARLLAEQRRAMRFAAGVAGLMRPRRGLIDGIAAETVVCRCEDVTRGEIEAAIAAGAREVNQLKHFTRCGMGPCQGRMCGEVAAELVARHGGGRAAAGRWSMRPPLRPVPLDALLGAFAYDDIPVPEPAPL